MAVAIILLAACTSPVQRAADAPTSTVSGTVTYNVRTALPPDAVVTVELQDGTDAGSPAIVVGQQQITTSGSQVPIAFEIIYKPGTINQDHVYSVAAKIRGANGSPFFASDTNVPVITKGNPIKDVEIVVLPVTGSEQAAGSGNMQDAGSGLVGKSWQVVSLNGNLPVANTALTTRSVGPTAATRIRPAIKSNKRPSRLRRGSTP